MNKLLVNTLVSIGLCAATLPVLAQPANPPAARAAPGPQGQRPGNDRQREFGYPGARVEARLAYIKTALKITDAQQPQWDAYANTIRKQAAGREQQMQAWRGQRSQYRDGQMPTAISRLELQQQMLSNAASSAAERLTVERPLYAALSADQKKVADQLLVPQRRFGNSREREHRRRA